MKHTNIRANNRSKQHVQKVGAFAIAITLIATLLCGCVRSGKTRSFRWASGSTYNSTSIDKYIGKGGDVDIYSEFGYHSVGIIGEGSFQNCTDVTSVKIPDSVKYIEDYAFQNCTGLSSITFTKSGQRLAPYGCSIENCTFQNCSALTSIVLPYFITSIGDAAFDNCSNLHSVYFDGDAPKLGSNVFSNTASDFTVYYHADKYGWSDTWNGYRTATY